MSCDRRETGENIYYYYILLCFLLLRQSLLSRPLFCVCFARCFVSKLKSQLLQVNLVRNSTTDPRGSHAPLLLLAPISTSCMGMPAGCTVASFNFFKNCVYIYRILMLSFLFCSSKAIIWSGAPITDR